MDKIERLINLTACLLDSSKPLSFDELRTTVYRGVSKSDKALKRMFERDKDELREMGIDVETVGTEWGDESAYTIPRDQYYLPHVDLDPDERVALTMVSRLFLGSGTPFSVPAQLALLKLAFEEQAPAGDVPHVHWVETPRDSELLGDILDGLMRRKVLTFSYRTLSSAAPVQRDIEPYGLFNKGGAWYVIGHCRLRDDTRCFKLERIVSQIAVNQAQPKTPDFEVPADFDMHAEIDWERPYACEPDITAVVLFKPRLAFAAPTQTARVVSEMARPDGSLEVTYDLADAGEFVDWVLGFGTDVLILSPEPLRQMVRDRLAPLAQDGGRQ